MNRRVKAVRPSYQSWLPGTATTSGASSLAGRSTSASPVSSGSQNIAAYGPTRRSLYSWIEANGYT